MDNYNSFGKHIDFKPDNIVKGDNVSYTYHKRINNITAECTLFGVWDGEKVEFTDDNKTVVRTIKWLEKHYDRL